MILPRYKKCGGGRVARDVLVAVVVFVGGIAVAVDEDLLAVGRIDSRRAHHFECRHRLAFFVEGGRKRRGGVGFVLGVLVFQVVADLDDPVAVVAQIEEEVQIRVFALQHVQQGIAD